MSMQASERPKRFLTTTLVTRELALFTLVHCSNVKLTIALLQRRVKEREGKEGMGEKRRVGEASQKGGGE